MPGEEDATLLTGQDNTDGDKGTDGENAGGTGDDATGEGGDKGGTGEGEGGTGDDKTGEGEDGAGGGEGEGDGEKETGAREKYEDFNIPEGVEVDAALLEKASPLFKEFNLTQEQAQKAVDLLAEARAGDAKALTDSLKTAREAWVSDAKADKEIGGANFKENLGVAGKALAAFGTPELSGLLKASGFGDHPEVIRVFHRIGKAMSDDKLVTKDGQSSEQDSLDGFYDKSDHKRA